MADYINKNGLSIGASNKELFEEWCHKMSFIPISFSSHQSIRDKKELIYHTNVMISVADKYAVLWGKRLNNDFKENALVLFLSIP